MARIYRTIGNPAAFTRTFPRTDSGITALPAFDDAPVFYVCTTENMTSFESESLIATGVDGYIKFKNENALGRFKDEPLFKNYGLKFAKTCEIYK